VQVLGADKVVGVLLKGYPRLSETFIINEILLLEKLGYTLHIFALRNPGEATVHERVRRVRARVTYIPDHIWRYFGAFVRTNIHLWWRRPGVYWQALRFAVGSSWQQRSTATIKRLAQAAYLVEQGLPDAGIAHVHAHFSNDPTTVAFFVSWLTGISYSISAHAKDIYLQEPAFLRQKIARARFVVTCTEYNKTYLQEMAGTATPILRCYHGINLEFFSVPVQSHANACPHILSVGRLVPKKGFPVLLQALHLLRQQGADFRCTIIGSGPMESELRQHIMHLGLAACVALLAPMSQDELLRYYHAADVFALACEVDHDGDRDGLPNVIMEAMAMGLPVLSTHVSGIPECVDQGVHGILVPEKDPEAFAEGLATLLGQPDRARQFGRAGREKVERDFDAVRTVERISVALRQAIACSSQENGLLPTGKTFFSGGGKHAIR
jgi:glycosyltransferase involved in cell wall biosynthesis